MTIEKICKNCAHRGGAPSYPGDCMCPKLHEPGSPEENENDDHLCYSYNEGGGFEVGDNFGCVHFSPSATSQDETASMEPIDLLNSLVGDLCADLTKKTDDVFAEAITRALGNGWTIDDLKGRCERIRTLHSKCETVTLDGKPILEIYDPTHDVDPGNIFRSTVKYRFLIPNKEISGG